MDVKLVYLQFDELLIREIFNTHPAKVFELLPEENLELLKLIYGLAEFEE